MKSHICPLQPMLRHSNTLTSLLLFIISIWLPPQVWGAEEQTAQSEAQVKPVQYQSVEERRLIESMNTGDNRVFAQEREDIERRKKELKRIEAEVDKKIDQLNQLRQKLEKLLAEKDAAELKRTADLAKMYEKMPANKAAMVLGTIDEDLAIAILGKVKTKAAAKILSNMEQEKAAALTTSFSTLDK